MIQLPASSAGGMPRPRCRSSRSGSARGRLDVFASSTSPRSSHPPSTLQIGTRIPNLLSDIGVIDDPGVCVPRSGGRVAPSPWSPDVGSATPGLIYRADRPAGGLPDVRRRFEAHSGSLARPGLPFPDYTMDILASLRVVSIQPCSETWIDPSGFHVTPHAQKTHRICLPSLFVTDVHPYQLFGFASKAQ